jgi:rare lipoprotein A
VLVFVLAFQSQTHRRLCRNNRALFGKTVLAFLLGMALVPGLDLLRIDTGNAAVVNNGLQSELDDGPVVVLSLAHLNPQRLPPAPADEPGDIAAAAEQSDLANEGNESLVIAAPAPEACAEIDPSLVAGFQSLLRQVTALKHDRVLRFAALAQTRIVGTASTYNPYDDGGEAEYFETASGELYDPADWTAAIQIDLRNDFGGVRYGRNYRPAYVLVESGGKHAIVKINDVGPLRPGRVIDLNEQSMRYFDPSMQLGLVPDVKVTLLPGEDWTPGPVGGQPPVSIASAN